MDSGVHSAVTNGLTLFKLDSISMFAEVMGIAIGVLITITGAYMAIKWFLELSGVSGHTDYEVDRKNIMRESPYWYAGIDYNDSKYDDYIEEHRDD